MLCEQFSSLCCVTLASTCTSTSLLRVLVLSEKVIEFPNLFRSCPPPPVRYTPPFTESVPLHGKLLYKLYGMCVGGGANDTQPLSLGGINGKDPNFPYFWLYFSVK